MQDQEKDFIVIVDIPCWDVIYIGMLTMVGNLIKLDYVRTEMQEFVAFSRSHLCQMTVVTNDK